MSPSWRAFALVAASTALVACEQVPTRVVQQPRPPAAARDLFNAGDATDLGNLGGRDLTPLSINDMGEAIGTAIDATGYTRLWLSLDGAKLFAGPQLWSTLSQGDARAINDAGEIVGRRDTPEGCCVAFVAEPNGSVTDLPTPAGTLVGSVVHWSDANAINRAGDVAGNFFSSDGNYHAAFWPKGGQPVDLGTMGAQKSFARGINDRDEVVGVTITANQVQHAFYWSAATGMLDLGQGAAYDINNDGIVVGGTKDGGFVWSRARGKSIVSVPDGYYYIEPEAINDNGVFVGLCQDGRDHGCAGIVSKGIFYVSDDGDTSRMVSINDRNVALGMIKPMGGDPHGAEWQLSVPADHAPVVSIGGPYAGYAGTALSLTWSASDEDQDVLAYSWDFGDGTRASGTTLPTSHRWTTKGTYTLTLSADDGRGGVETQTATVTISDPLDTTAPVIDASVTGTLGLAGWYTSDVALAWRESDPESGVTSTSGCGPAAVSTNTPGAAFTCTATNGAGLTASRTETIRRDASLPTVTSRLVGTLGLNGWYTSDVSVAWTVAANGPSGATAGAGCAPGTIATDTRGTTLSCTGTSGAGLTSTRATTIQRDATPPSIAYAGNAGTYTVDQTVAITCTAADATSGLASSTCANVSGDAYTFSLGANAFAASASDVAGNVAHASTSFTVEVTAASLGNLTRRWVTNQGIASSLCAKLDAAHGSGNPNQIGAYVNELQAQSGKSIPADEALILERLAGAL